jgi:hypothetical protein
MNWIMWQVLQGTLRKLLQPDALSAILNQIIKWSAMISFTNEEMCELLRWNYISQSLISGNRDRISLFLASLI